MRMITDINNHRKRFVMMAGIPASGKTTLAKKIAERTSATYYSSDDLRSEYSKGVGYVPTSKKIFKEIENNIVRNLRCEGFPDYVIEDATSLKKKDRENILKLIKEGNDKKEWDVVSCAVVVLSPFERCLMENARRVIENKGTVVPTEAMIKMLMNFQCPQIEEGFDEIYFVTNYSNMKSTSDEVWSTPICWNSEFLHILEDICKEAKASGYYEGTKRYYIAKYEEFERATGYEETISDYLKLLDNITNNKTRVIFENVFRYMFLGKRYFQGNNIDTQNISSYESLFYLFLNKDKNSAVLDELKIVDLIENFHPIKHSMMREIIDNFNC